MVLLSYKKLAGLFQEYVKNSTSPVPAHEQFDNFILHFLLRWHIMSCAVKLVEAIFNLLD